MPLTHTMRDLFSKFTTTEDSSGERFGSTGAYIHVGSSTAAFAATQNSMQSTGAYVRPMESGYPQRTANVLTYRILVSTDNGNFPWEEWGVKNTTATSTGSGTLMQRALDALGTKPSTQAWQLTATITVST